MQADLLGVMVWWNVQLNAVSLVNLVMVRILLALLILDGRSVQTNRAQGSTTLALNEWHRGTAKCAASLRDMMNYRKTRDCRRIRTSTC